jgi:hypothetical protein
MRFRNTDLLASAAIQYIETVTTFSYNMKEEPFKFKFKSKRNQDKKVALILILMLTFACLKKVGLVLYICNR